MTSKTYLFASTLFVALFVASNGLAVDSHASESAFIAHLETEQLLKGQPKCCGEPIDNELLREVMKRGWFDASLKLIDACVDTGKKIDSGVHQAASLLRKKISEVTSFLQTAKMSNQAISPAFEWAQSRDSVFLNVKFAHKLDAPACIDLKEKEVVITARGVVLVHDCTGKNKHFKLDLELYGEVEPETSTWTMASVGRGTLTLKKSNPDTKWARLLKSPTEKPRNMHTWWTLHEKYEAELNRVERDALKKKVEDKKKEAAEQEQQQETPENVTGVAADETQPVVDPVDEEKAKQKVVAQKKSKSESKKLKKESKKAVKELDSKHKDALARLEGQRNKLEKEHKAKRKELQDSYLKRIEQVEEKLQDALKQIDNFALDANATPSTGLQKLVDMVSGFIFRTEDPEPESQDEVPQDNADTDTPQQEDKPEL